MPIPTTKVVRTRSVAYPTKPAKSRRAEAARTKYKAKRPTRSQSIDIWLSLFIQDFSNRKQVNQ